MAGYKNRIIVVIAHNSIKTMRSSSPEQFFSTQVVDILNVEKTCYIIFLVYLEETLAVFRPEHRRYTEFNLQIVFFVGLRPHNPNLRGNSGGILLPEGSWCDFKRSRFRWSFANQ